MILCSRGGQGLAHLKHPPKGNMFSPIGKYKRCYERGRDDCKRGLTRQDNPFNISNRFIAESSWWEKGFLDEVREVQRQ